MCLLLRFLPFCIYILCSFVLCVLRAMWYSVHFYSATFQSTSTGTNSAIDWSWIIRPYIAICECCLSVIVVKLFHSTVWLIFSTLMSIVVVIKQNNQCTFINFITVIKATYSDYFLITSIYKQQKRISQAYNTDNKLNMWWLFIGKKNYKKGKSNKRCVVSVISQYEKNHTAGW